MHNHIYIMRHGKTVLDKAKRSDGYIDLPLSEQGQAGVVAAADEHLKGIPFQHLYAPDLKRTQETGHIISSAMPSQPPVHTHNGLKTWNLGYLSGAHKKLNKRIVQYLLDNPGQTPLGGEAYGKFTHTFDAAIDEQKRGLTDGSLQGPILNICSGSNCRRLGETLLHNRQALNIDEAGIILLYPDESGQWGAAIISGGADDNDEIS